MSLSFVSSSNKCYFGLFFSSSSLFPLEEDDDKSSFLFVVSLFSSIFFSSYFSSFLSCKSALSICFLINSSISSQSPLASNWATLLLYFACVYCYLVLIGYCINSYKNSESFLPMLVFRYISSSTNLSFSYSSSISSCYSNSS